MLDLGHMEALVSRLVVPGYLGSALCLVLTGTV